jgi:hypothetical protein
MDVYINRTDGINNPVGTNESKSSFTERNWTVGLGAFADKLMPKGAIGSHLEINCHGEPGKLKLLPDVTQENVTHFATLVRKLIRPGGFIEIMACLVARFPIDSIINQLKVQVRSEAGQAGVDVLGLPAPGTSFSVGQLVVARDALVRLNRRLDGIQFMPVAQASLELKDIRREVKRDMRAVVELMQIAIRSNLTFIPNPDFPQAQTEWDRNGPLLCSTLARLTQCKVRAAIIPQAEEGEGYGFQSFGYAFGNWDGDVFDFLADGQVRHVGLNVPRPVFRTHDEHGDGPLRLV